MESTTGSSSYNMQPTGLNELNMDVAVLLRKMNELNMDIAVLFGKMTIVQVAQCNSFPPSYFFVCSRYLFLGIFVCMCGC